MASGGKSLRWMVEQWLAAGCSKDVRVTAFRSRPSKHECYVCVEAFTGGGRVAMFFFRHRDGSWRIYPPSRERLALRFN